MKWADRITRARRRGKFNETDMFDVGNWCGCFVGEVTGGRAPGSLPLPFHSRRALEEAGIEAPNAVFNHDFARARKLLAQIKRIASSKTFKAALRKVRSREREADRVIGGSL